MPIMPRIIPEVFGLTGELDFFQQDSPTLTYMISSRKLPGDGYIGMLSHLPGESLPWLLIFCHPMPSKRFPRISNLYFYLRGVVKEIQDLMVDGVQGGEQ